MFLIDFRRRCALARLKDVQTVGGSFAVAETVHGTVYAIRPRPGRIFGYIHIASTDELVYFNPDNYVGVGDGKMPEVGSLVSFVSARRPAGKNMGRLYARMWWCTGEEVRQKTPTAQQGGGSGKKQAGGRRVEIGKRKDFKDRSSDFAALVSGINAK